MSGTRARKQAVLVLTDWDDILNVPSDLGADQVTYENLAANGDVGTDADQVAQGSHDHDVGNQVLNFENALV
jgi:hypothetical protein